MFTQVIARLPGADFASGLTTAALGAPEFNLILQQHEDYLHTFERLGIAVTLLPALPGYPDAYFVEDTAVVTPELAVIARPGAAARRGEEDSMEPVLARFRPTVRIEGPGTLDGGDVLMVERHFFIGVSERTNAEGAAQLGAFLEPHGYTWQAVPVAAGLHLKSSVTYVGQNTLLITPTFADRPEFARYARLVVPAEEEYAANTLLVNEHLITPAGFPRTRGLLETLGYPVIEQAVSEPRKMDGGLSCMTLRF